MRVCDGRERESASHNLGSGINATNGVTLPLRKGN